jgi:Na+-driven multidrug efflux pump
LLCCAAISTTNDPYKYLLNPGLGYAQTAFPIVVALVSVAAPVLVARAVAGRGGSPEEAVAGVEVALFVVAAAMAWWLGVQVAARRPVKP